MLKSAWLDNFGIDNSYRKGGLVKRMITHRVLRGVTCRVNGKGSETRMRNLENIME